MTHGMTGKLGYSLTFFSQWPMMQLLNDPRMWKRSIGWKQSQTVYLGFMVFDTVSNFLRMPKCCDNHDIRSMVVDGAEYGYWLIKCNFPCSLYERQLFWQKYIIAGFCAALICLIWPALLHNCQVMARPIVYIKWTLTTIKCMVRLREVVKKKKDILRSGWPTPPMLRYVRGSPMKWIQSFFVWGRRTVGAFEGESNERFCFYMF